MGWTRRAAATIVRRQGRSAAVADTTTAIADTTIENSPVRNGQNACKAIVLAMGVSSVSYETPAAENDVTYDQWLLVDSGAVIHVCPPSFGNTFPLVESQRRLRIEAAGGQ